MFFFKKTSNKETSRKEDVNTETLAKENVWESAAIQTIPAELLEIDRELGLSYCMNMEDFYVEMQEEFCNQATEYLPKLEEHYNAEDWKQYAVVAHALKGNSLNIGASNFSKYSLQHELAGKEGNVDFIKKEYAGYVQALKTLMDKLQNQ